MSPFNEHSLEMAIMELFAQQGYSYQSGDTIHKELSEVLLRDDLRMFLMERYANDGITKLEAECAIERAYIPAAEPFWKLLVKALEEAPVKK